MKKIYLLIAIILTILILNGCTKTYTIDIEYDTDMGSIEGVGSYEEGSTVRIKATPSDGYALKEWTLNGEVASKNTRFTFKVTEDKSYKAIFVKEGSIGSNSAIYFTVNARSESESVGDVVGDGSYRQGTEATLTATAKEGFEFDRWETRDETLSEKKEFSFVVDSDYDIVARFKEKIDHNKEKFSVDVTPSHPEAVYEIYTYKTETGMLSNEFTENDEIAIQITNLHPTNFDEDIKEKISYKYTGLYDGDKLLTTDFNYNFSIKKDMNLEARFEPLSLDNFSISENQSKTYKDLKISDKFNEALISPNKKYVLGIGEEFIYVVNSSSNSLNVAYKIDELIKSKASDIKCTWDLESTKFTVSNKKSLVVQSLSENRLEINPPDFKGVHGRNPNQWIHSKFIENHDFQTTKFYLNAVTMRDDQLALITYLQNSCNVNLSFSLMDLDTSELFTKEITQIYSNFGYTYIPSSSGFVIDKNGSKILYSFNNGILPERESDTITGYFDLEKQKDNEISIRNLGNFPSVSTVNAHGTPLMWLDENQILFKFIPFASVPLVEHLYVLDTENEKVVFIRNDEALNSSLAIENVGESDKYTDKVLSSSYSSEDNSTTIHLSSINLTLKDLTGDTLEQMPIDYSNYLHGNEHSPEIEREFILSRYDNYYDLESEEIFTIKDNLIIKNVFADKNDNLIINMSYNPQEKSNRDKNMHYLFLIDEKMNCDLVYECEDPFQVINVSEDSFTILKDNKIQRINR